MYPLFLKLYSSGCSKALVLRRVACILRYWWKVKGFIYMGRYCDWGHRGTWYVEGWRWSQSLVRARRGCITSHNTSIRVGWSVPVNNDDEDEDSVTHIGCSVSAARPK